jgi:hypothetical protein
MMTVTERPSVTFGQVLRKPIVNGLNGWISEIEELTPLQIAQHNFAEWSRVLGDFNKLASENLYEKSNFTMLDIRQHSAALHQMIGQGEMIAVQFLSLQMPKETESYVSFIDEQVKRLHDILTDWHGDPELHDDTPDSFKEAMREYAEGKTVDLEADVFEVDASAEEHISA